MKIKDTHFLQAISLGLLAGMRTMSAPVVTSHLLSHHPSKYLKVSPLKFMQSDITAAVFKILAVGELIGDKMPTAPNRIAAPGVIGRCLAGALSGSAIFKARNGNGFTGALIGGTSAIAGTFGSFFLRRAIVKNSSIPDAYIGALEDALVIGAGIALIKNR